VQDVAEVGDPLRRWVGKAAAGLLAVYLVAMASSVGWGDVARYAVPVEIGAALLVSACPAVRGRRAAAIPLRGAAAS
jgi:hypothetical protein